MFLVYDLFFIKKFAFNFVTNQIPYLFFKYPNKYINFFYKKKKSDNIIRCLLNNRVQKLKHLQYL